MILHSLEWWNRNGFRIKKGSKHIRRNKKGVCLFSDEQTYKPEKRRSRVIWKNWDNHGWDVDHDDDYEVYGYAYDGLAEWGW